MTTTQDGHILSIGDLCWIVALDDNDEYIESLTKCVYKGFSVVEHELAPPPLPIGCSGSIFLPNRMGYFFERVGNVNICFDLLKHEVGNIVIKDLSSVAEMVKMKLK